jgi:hypothetical protein
MSAKQPAKSAVEAARRAGDSQCLAASVAACVAGSSLQPCSAGYQQSRRTHGVVIFLASWRPPASFSIPAPPPHPNILCQVAYLALLLLLLLLPLSSRWPPRVSL